MARALTPFMGLLAWLAIFVPGHLAEWWVERAFVAAVVLVCGASLLLQGVRPGAGRASRRVLFFLSLAQLVYTSSYVFSVAFRGAETGVRDLFELGRYFFHAAFLLALISRFDRGVLPSYERALLASLGFSLLVLVCYLWPVPGLTPLFKSVLYEGTKTLVGGYGPTRLAAPFENPNYLGYHLTLTLVYLGFFSGTALRLPAMGLAVFLVFVTGSRTAWAASLYVLGLWLAAHAYVGVRGLKLRYAFQAALLLCALLGTGYALSDRIMENTRVRRIVSAVSRGDIQEESNAAKRLEQAREAWGYFTQAPVLGWGPSKYETMKIVDNQYILWMMRHGVIGTGVILAGLALFSWGLLRRLRGDPIRLAGGAAFLGAVALMLLTGQFLENFRLFYLTAFLATAARLAAEP